MAGDIISFRYPSKGSTKLHSILVLGKNIPYKKNDGTKSLHLAGMKIEMSNQPLITASILITNLSKAGEIKLVQKISLNEAIIKVDVDGNPNEKRVDLDFKKIEPFMKQFNLYRTYDYLTAKKYTVYYEPIKLTATYIKKLEGLDED